ncbi:uncharacterized protein LOC128202640 isoform X2 [Mya arenaria]|uniref:uncharacterized protein LOC128202640 isoform X2 n=1 Tax=Mya arenaria TaxID=6604 RepID=UPI0022DECEE4|nr:uncharacterized protein LOC128202640 isoform X2 [Mya arenaria]
MKGYHYHDKRHGQNKVVSGVARTGVVRGGSHVLFAGTCVLGARETILLKLWRHQIEVGFMQPLRLKEGNEFTVTCDGSRVPGGADPRLRWYGPDKHWIVYEGPHNRVHVEHSFSGRFLRLHFREVLPEDAGKYVCRGWMGYYWGWQTAAVTVTILARPTRRPLVKTTHDVTELRTETTTSLRTETSTSLRTKTTTSLPPGEVTTEQPEPIVSVTSGNEECISPRFQCGSGECFDESYRCDDFPDCVDETDEQNCASSICIEGMRSCADGDGCVTSQQLCDGHPHCRDGSDESPYFCG